ncbi:MAG TPA: cytochrome c peroxidase [Burkholderiaceae bacterium]|nr:cytochrome c peroxidase [Burkholderiaceae bacterium]
MIAELPRERSAPRAALHRAGALLVACLAAVLIACLATRQVRSAESPLALSETERALLLAQGPWPPTPARDPTNRFSGSAAAIALGRTLFFEKRLSRNGLISCASCHDPAQGFSDGRARALGMGEHDRNSQSLLNVGLQRWFGWDGGADSLWAATLRPLLAAHEMGSDAARVAGVIRADPALSNALAQARRERPRAQQAGGARAAGAQGNGSQATGLQAAGAQAASTGDVDELLMVDAAKTIAAFVETLVTPRTAFDDFRDAVARSDAAAAARYPASARRGLALFIGRGNCVVCHFGPGFSNGEFHDVGMPFLVAPGRVDPGRHAGIQRVRADRYNLLGPFNDQLASTGQDSEAAALKTRTVTPAHRNFGEWRTPGLRGLSASAPYMHDGRLKTLEEVVRHYDRLDVDRLHADGEALLRPLRLTEEQKSDLLSFLRSLDPPAP